MTTDGEFLRRFMLAADTLPPDLRAWATGLILVTLPASARLAQRDRLLREAASLVPLPTCWEKAQHLRAHFRDMARALPAAAPLCTVRGLVANAMLLYPGKQLSVRQIYRVLTDKTGLEMSVTISIASGHESDREATAASPKAHHTCRNDCAGEHQPRGSHR